MTKYYTLKLIIGLNIVLKFPKYKCIENNIVILNCINTINLIENYFQKLHRKFKLTEKSNIFEKEN